MPASGLTLRRESAGDAAAIAGIVTRAFGQADEADLVAALRSAGALSVSVVAEENGRMLAHAAASPMTWVSGGTGAVLATAPVAVDPAAQGRGLGRAVVRAAIAEARSTGASVLTVLGDPDWYGGFGFEPAVPHGIAVAGFDFGAAFKVMALVPGALAQARGSLARHDAFAPLLAGPH